MRFHWINKRLLFTSFSATFIIVGTLLAIRFAKGNRPTRNGEVRETGLLVANSFPTGAQVFINGDLSTATDTTLYLDPGEYEVEIRKDGYTPWKKTLTLEKELVTQTNAVLFPTAPSLSSLTFTGVQNTSPAPDGQKLVYFTASASAEEKNGLYVVDLTDNPLSLQRGSRQIAQPSTRINLEKSRFIWSPDSSELIVSDGSRHAILDITRQNNLDTLTLLSSLQLKKTLSTWEEEMYLRERQILTKFPNQIIAMATTSATNVYFSPDQEKLLYTASTSAQLPENIIDQLPATNTQPEQRNLEVGGVYVYDRKEDKNFRVGTIDNLSEIPQKKLLAIDLSTKPLDLESSPSAFVELQATNSAMTADIFRQYHSALYTGKIQWFPDSSHLIRTTPRQISILEYDGTNETTVYAGQFDPDFVYPWSNGNKLLLWTSFNQLPLTEKNLYAVQLRE